MEERDDYHRHLVLRPGRSQAIRVDRLGREVQVREHHALGRRRRARGVDDESGVRLRDIDEAVRLPGRCDLLELLAEADEGDLPRFRSVRKDPRTHRVRESHLRPAVSDEVVDFNGDRPDVERHSDPAHGVDRKERRRVGDAVETQDEDAVTWDDSALLQVSGDCAHTSIELPPGHGTVRPRERDVIGATVRVQAEHVHPVQSSAGCQLLFGGQGIERCRCRRCGPGGHLCGHCGADGPLRILHHSGRSPLNDRSVLLMP